jgi:hypothetical protein
MNKAGLNAINGGPDPRFNQSLDWFLNSEHYTAKVPLNFLFLNEANQLETGSVPWYKGRDVSFSRGVYQPGDKVALYYANESVLNFANAEGKDVINFEVNILQECIKEFNIPIKDIILIGNLYQYNNCFSIIAHSLGLSEEQLVLIDYYEMQTFFFHNVLGAKFNQQFNPTAPKDLRYQFGKVNKPVRIITMHELWEKNMLDNAVTGCLIDKNDIELLAREASAEYETWFKKIVPHERIAEMLNQHHGSIDNAKYFYFKRNNAVKNKIEVINHCPGYPYDYEKIFSETKVSLVPETFYYNNQGSFLTEKIYKTIYNHHPFTLLGTPGLLSLLRSRGYKTFSNICNEMYDLCNNDRKRVSMVIDATTELIQSNNHSELNMITKHNFSQLEKNTFSTVALLNSKISKAFN